ncbi:MAG: penicillin-binding protein activator, partial [Bdellovibrionaceae bacterium]|nr:penicillin-binding protein activator [Pseudobdellovibrionaceae bacterium]
MKYYFSLAAALSFCFLLACSSAPMIQTHSRGNVKKPGEHASTNRGSSPVLHQSSELNKSVLNTLPTGSEAVSAAQTPASTIMPIPVSSIIKAEPQPRITSDKSFSTEYKKIGVILPLTGKISTLGQRALSAIRLGLGISDSSSDFSLALYDTQGSPELAAKGVEKLLQDDKVIAIMGGLGAKEATAIAQKAEFFQVPFFTFSQKSDLTNNAIYTFRNSVTPAMQTSKLVDFATQKLGYKKFAILYPNDAYGVEFANQFWDHVLAYGGTVVAAQVYDPKDVDLSVYIQKMVGTYYVENRAEEYKEKIDALKEKDKKKNPTGTAKKKNRENEVVENILEPIVDFDAIFIPDSSKAMGQAIGFFRSADVAQMTYLGTNLWNTEDLARRANQSNANKLNHFYFVDTIITDEQRKKSQFNSAFINTYKEDPSIIEVQTYESAKILRDTISNGARDRSSLANRLKELGR